MDKWCLDTAIAKSASEVFLSALTVHSNTTSFHVYWFSSVLLFVFVDGEKVRVRGRLMTINGVEYVTDADTFPSLNATVSASVFLTPKAEGVTAGATPAGPEAAPAAAAPVSTASTGSTPPTPTATATP